MATTEYQFLTDATGRTSSSGGDREGRGAALGWVYGAGIFASAFLLFEVQPLITKMILPWFGGVAAVWTVCLVFFQVVLLLGYFYAHLLTSKCKPRAQGRVHAGLLLLSLLALPILPRNSLQPSGPGSPTWHILTLLALTIGLPYLVLSSTSPVLQAWYAQERPGRSPYRFYALSNVGSMLALLSYPVLVEPRFALTHQAVGWSVAYAAVVMVCGGLAILAAPRGNRAIPVPPASSTAPSWKRRILWVALAACGSALLLAVTNHVSENIASVPFLWILPLSLYLLSFIFCFDSRRWYRRDFFLRLLAVALGGMAYGLDPSFAILPIKVLIPLYCAGLWVCCMFCHGELARFKPEAQHLTSFYLMAALGGAIGAVLVALVAPHVFSGYYEMECSLGCCALLVLVVRFPNPRQLFQTRPGEPPGWVLGALVAALLVSLALSAGEGRREARRSVRNFYGVLRVIDHEGADPGGNSGSARSSSSAKDSGRSSMGPGGIPSGDRVVATPHIPAYLSPYQTSYRRLMNGTIDHGLQFLSPELRREATSYYSVNSGIGVALRAIAGRGALRMGLVGLGAGTLATYGRPGDRYTFYEINPLDVRIAQEEFSFLRDSKAQTNILLGDARLLLEAEAPQGYDALVVDAFSSDSIPVHLLTREALELYFRHLKPDGLLALHISNQYVNLQPVVEAGAAVMGKEAVLINNADDHPHGIYSASWILLGSLQGFYGRRDIERAGAILLPSGQQRVWTDNYSSVFRLLK